MPTVWPRASPGSPALQAPVWHGSDLSGWTPAVHYGARVKIDSTDGAVLRRFLNPPKQLQWNDVPEAIRQAVESSFPGFAAQSPRCAKNCRKYVFVGTYNGNPGRVEVDCDSEGRLLELEKERQAGR